MGERTGIEWTDATWNPVIGCRRVSPGCTNCYAMKLAGGRLAKTEGYRDLTRGSKAGPVWTGEVRLIEKVLDQPLRWRRPRMIFVNSMGDLFHEDVPDGWIMRLLNRMFQCPQHTFQVLTKRPERMKDFMRRWGDLEGENVGDFKNARGPDAVREAHPSGRGELFAAMLEAMGTPPPGCAYPTFDWMHGMIGWPLWPANVWLGTSCEDQERADQRIPHLLATPAAVRFVSLEPLLGPIDLAGLDDQERSDFAILLDWVIVGGESGPGARPMHPDWARSLRDQCAAAGVPFFFKQWGEFAPGNDVMRRVGKKRAGRLLDGVEHNAAPGARHG